MSKNNDPKTCGKSWPILQYESNKILFYMCKLDRSGGNFLYKDGRCYCDCNGSLK